MHGVGRSDVSGPRNVFGKRSNDHLVAFNEDHVGESIYFGKNKVGLSTTVACRPQQIKCDFLPRNCVQ